MSSSVRFGGFFMALAMVIAGCTSTGDSTTADDRPSETAGETTSTPESAEGTESDEVEEDSAPKRIALPGDGVYPEGIAIDDSNVYVTSFGTGAVFTGTTDDEELSVFVEGVEGSMAVGVVADDDRVFVARGGMKHVSVYDLEGEEVATVSSESAMFLNDLTVVGDYVYVTDSQAPTIWRFPTSVSGEVELEPWADVTETIEYVEGFNLNGIRPGPDGTLATVNFATGEFYTISLETGEVAAVELEGGELKAGDGLVSDGSGKLWLVSGLEGSVVSEIEFTSPEKAKVKVGQADDAVAFATTGAFDADGNLWVVSSQFDKGGPMGEGTPELPFYISTTDLP